MPKITDERIAAFRQDHATAVAIVAKVSDQALAIAKKHGLSIRMPSRLNKHFGRDWEHVLDIDGTQPEYRIGFTVSLSPQFSPVDTAYIWSIVTDLKTGKWQQYLRDKVPLADLETLVREGLDKFGKWLDANDGLDPIEQARLKAGTAYYWGYTRDDGLSTWEADFGGDWCGYVEGKDDEYELTIMDAGGETLFSSTGKKPRDLIALAEQKLTELRSAKPSQTV